MIPNTCPKTGHRYGVINANSLNGDVLDDIVQNGEALWEKEALHQHLAAKKAAYGRMVEALTECFEGGALTDIREQIPCLADALEDWTQEFYDSWTSEAETYVFADIDGVSGHYDTESGVVMIFDSPTLVCARPCSPCYPNAGDLDSVDGSFARLPVKDFREIGTLRASDCTFDVPPDWRAE